MSKWAANTSEIRDNGFGASRNGKTIEGAVLHHGAGTNVLGYVANANSRDSHPTYHVSNGGRVTGIVHPDRRPFSTSHSVDSVAVTFEIDNESAGGDWPVSDEALSAVIDVIVDHARQGGYKVIGKNTPGKDQPDLFFVAWHQQYVQTACPGPYVLGKIDWIIKEANKRLSGGKPTTAPESNAKPVPAKPAAAWAFNPPNQATQKRVQEALKARGRYNGPADGVWGMNTIKGIQDTIRRVGYTGPIDGIPGERTCHYVQVYAQMHGSYAGPVDSILGPNSWAGFALGLERP